MASPFDLSTFLITVSKITLQCSYPGSSLLRTLRGDKKLYFLANAWNRVRWARPGTRQSKLVQNRGGCDFFAVFFSFGKNEMFRLQYSRTSKQRPTWGQKKVANVETWPLSGGRVVTWQKFKGVQQVYCAKFMLIVSHNGNPTINNGRKTVPAFLTCSQWLNCGGNRGEIGRQHEKAHSCSHFSPCFDHTSPTQTDDGTSQIDHEIGAYVP